MYNVSTSTAQACAKFGHFQQARNHIFSETKHQDFEMFAEITLVTIMMNSDTQCWQI